MYCLQKNSLRKQGTGEAFPLFALSVGENNLLAHTLPKQSGSLCTQVCHRHLKWQYKPQKKKRNNHMTEAQY